MLSLCEAWDTGVKAPVPVPLVPVSFQPKITAVQVTIMVSQTLVPNRAGVLPFTALVSTSLFPLIGQAPILASLVTNQGHFADSDLDDSALVTGRAMVRVGLGV